MKRNIPVREQTSLHERKWVSLSSEMHKYPQIERYVGSSLLRISREENYDI